MVCGDPDRVRSYLDSILAEACAGNVIPWDRNELGVVGPVVSHLPRLLPDGPPPPPSALDTSPDPLAAHPPPQNSPSRIGASTAVTSAFNPNAIPANVPATVSTVKARAVPMPWAARPAAKPRAA